MRPEPKKKIATNQPQSGLNQAFAKLEVSGLPEGSVVEPASPPKDGPASIWKLRRVVLRKETAHRGGKIVIVVHDFASHLPVSVIETMAKKIRQQCGCGGAVKGRTIEIQGDQAGRIRAVLEAEGFKVAGVS
jgi:translation initiation factor 1